MPSLVTLGDLKTKCREQANMEYSKFISDAELVRYINDSAKDLYNSLVGAGELYYLTSYDISIVCGTDTYDLPADFFKLLGVDYNRGGTVVSLKPFEFAERNKYTNISYINTTWYAPFGYVLIGNKLRFVPKPGSADTVTVHYAATLPDMVNDSDTIDGVSGFETFIIADVCIKMLAKEESDIQPFLIMKQDTEKRIAQMKRARDYSAPSRIADVNEPVLNQDWSRWFI